MDNQLLGSILIVLLLLAQCGESSIIATGICYAGCAGIVTVCFAAAGFTFGTVPIAVITATPALAACNSAFAACMKACTVALAVPVP